MKKRRSQRRVHPKAIIAHFREVFKTMDVKKTSLRNLLLSVVAVSIANTLRINEVASRLPIVVKNEKSKQKRFLRFLETAFPIQASQQTWLRFVLRRLWQAKTDKHRLILIDETDLLGGWKAIVAAVSFRKRAIPIFWWVYSNPEIRDMTHKSHNTLIQEFCLRTHQLACEVYPQRQQQPLLVFHRGFARAEHVIKFLKENDIGFLMRVPRNVCVLTQISGWTDLDAVSEGFHADILYQQTHQIHCQLFIVRDADFKDPMYLISNLHTGKQIHHCYKRRMRIEHGFRDIKSTFGFGKLVVKKNEKHRIQLLLLMAILAYGLCFFAYEKSADRWAKTLNTGNQKTFSVISVIKRIIRDQWDSEKLIDAVGVINIQRFSLQNH